MSTTNGKSQTTENPLTVEEMKAETKRLRVANRYYGEKLQANVLESLWGLQGNVFPGGSDLYEPLWTRMNQGRGFGIAPAQPSDRSTGRKWPLWMNDTDLNRYRAGSRILAGSNDYAKGYLANLVNSIIGKGFTYKIGGRDTAEAKQYGHRGQPEPQEAADGPRKATPLDSLCRVTQDWLERFFTRNNWTMTSLPEHETEEQTTLSGGETKEREACRRTFRDGDGILRLFRNSDGTVDVRFVDPELVWGSPAGKNYETDGWSFGVQTKIYRIFNEHTQREEIHHDREQVVAYFIRPSEPNEAANSNIGGEIVPACDIIQIKIPGEDCEVKHGTPLFTFETLESLLRASTLQRALSQSAAVRAATAEVWKHQIGTQQQIQSIQSPGIATPGIGAGPGAGTGGIDYLRMVGGGAVRRIPNSQEPVPFPTTTNVEEHQAAAQGDLRQAGTAVNMPEAMVSGDASNDNLNSAREAGAPYVNAREADQEHFKGPFLKLCWRVLRHAVACEKLPPEVLRLCSITVTPPIVHKDNKMEMAQVMTAELAAKVTSPQVEIGKRGNDARQIEQDWKEWDRVMKPAPVPGQPGQPEDGDGGAPVDPKRSEAAKEAAARRGLNLRESAERPQWVDVPDEILELLAA